MDLSHAFPSDIFFLDTSIVGKLEDGIYVLYLEASEHDYIVFYIPAEDLFIELNFSWTHGEHPFDPANLEDLTKLQCWQEKAKTSQYYKNAITTWTVRDYAKITTAKANNLNYKLYYKEEDLYEQYAGFKRVK